MRNVVIIGASGHAKVIIDALHCINQIEKQYGEIVLLDDDLSINGLTVSGHKVIGTVAECLNYKDSGFIIAIGNNEIRKKIAQMYSLKYMTVIHPKAIVADDVEIGEGTVIMAGAIINSGVKLGKHSIINTGATVDHDDCIADYVHLSPGAHLGGNVLIGEGTWIGIGGCVRNNINIGKKINVGAGGVVVKDLSESGTYVGVPVRRIR